MDRRTLLLALASCLPAAAASAQPEGRGGGPPNQRGGGPPDDRGRGGDGRGNGRGGDDRRESRGAASGAAFSDGERSVIVDFFRSNPTQAERLPPGIARNLERGKPLPPGIARRSLPSGLEGRLPTRDGGRYARILVGSDVVLIEVGSDLVLDILRGVLG
jgi:hypothetical protein